MLVVADDVIEASVSIDLTLDRNALSDILEALVEHSYGVIRGRTRLIPLFERN